MAKGEPMAIFLNIKRQRALSSMKKAKPPGNGGADSPFGGLSALTPGERIERGHSDQPAEDSPGFNPKTMGNKKYKTRKARG